MENSRVGLRRGVKHAVVLMNLGSPDSTSVPDLRRYLDEFLMDGRVIDIPWLLRALLVKGIIVPFRAPRSAAAYKSIWWEEGSPLIILSERLRVEVGGRTDVSVILSMRYGKPSAAETYRTIVNSYPDIEDVLLIPLYPHYAMSSYETAVEHMRSVHRAKRYAFGLHVIKPFYDQPEYIDALAESIRSFTDQEYDRILFSYHGIPERHVKKCDPTGNHCLKSGDCCERPSIAWSRCYRHQTRTTTRLVKEKLGLPDQKTEQTFQSRLGRDPWLKPYTAKRLEELPAEGVKKLLVVCPAFVSDCLETLQEVAIEGQESFLHAGGEQLQLIPCINLQASWCDAVAKWINDYFNGQRSMLLS